uniref:Uncharacterized protein n=1 Tax=Coccolithus braarudii TaxID=221442 RepID=A0A7S0PZ70_9EUKA
MAFLVFVTATAALSSFDRAISVTFSRASLLMASCGSVVETGTSAALRRRAFLQCAPLLAFGGAAVLPRAAQASYAMQKAAVAAHSWEATGKEKEKAVYDSIEDALDSKRRFRPEAGELGYVGGEYTKRSMQLRAEAEAEAASLDAKRDSSGYARPEELLGAGVARAASRRLVVP